MVSVGDVVVFCDEKGKDHNALATAVWGEDCINLVFVSSDESRRDQYGRQIQHESSVVHMHDVHGNYWRLPTEERVPYRAPQQV